MGIYQHTFYSEDLAAIMGEQNFVSLMLLVEARLAHSQAKTGLIPLDLANIISECARVELVDFEKLKSDIVLGGNVAIPLVKQLTTLVKLTDFEASKYVHLGATSQDIIDTATVLQLKQATTWVLDNLQKLESVLITLTQSHRDTLMIGRTLLQQAKPITFGFKTSLWLKSVRQDIDRISKAMDHLKYIQMGGAVGAGNNKLNTEVLSCLSIELDLKENGSWQTSRGNLCEYAAAMGILAGNLGKIAKDISLLMQTEIAEVFEGAAEGKGGSSTMPHKRNPVNCALILANATRTPALVSTMLSAMLQEHERSAGLWHAEWETLNTLVELTGGALEKSLELISNLEVNKEQMLRNIETTKGLIYAENVSLALADRIGKIKAHEYVQKACKKAIKNNKHLLSVLVDQKLDLEDMDKLFKANNSIGSTLSMIDETLAQ